MPRPPLQTRTISYRKLKQIDNSAFSTDLKDITNTLLKININQLVGDYNREMRQLLDRHAPIKSKTIVVRPLIPWFDDELKSLKSQRRKAELIWRRDINHETLLSFHRARNKYINALNTKQTYHLSHLILEAKGDSKKLFALINTLCGKKQSTPLPDHDSVENLVNEFGNFKKNKIDAIRKDIGVTEAPYIPFREEGVCSNLDTFAVVSENDVRKLVMKSKTTSCALDPMPTKLVKEYMEELLPLFTHIINISITTGEFPHKWKTALVVPLLKKAGLDPILKKLSSCIESPICVQKTTLSTLRLWISFATLSVCL